MATERKQTTGERRRKERETPSMVEGKMEEAKDEKSSDSPFLEVLSKSSGKIRRFAAGTTAGFAAHTIYRKLDAGGPRPLYIEAFKEGEEPVSFGANAVLVNYGKGWKLQTVVQGQKEAIWSRQMDMFADMGTSSNIHYSKKTKGEEKGSNLNYQYTAKILLVFVFMFLLGGILTFFLESLPDMRSSATSPM